jgi:dipeptidyl aminopeptidase/acylaminoacyl peptidase
MKYALLISLVVSMNAFAQKDNSLWHLNNYLWSYSKCQPVKSNKRLLDFESIENWQGLGGHLSISDDGKFFAYTTLKGHQYNDIFTKYDSLFIQSTDDNTVRWAFSNAIPGQFTADNKHYVFNVKDSIFILGLRSKEIKLVTNVQSYKLVANSRNEWMAWQLKNEASELVLHNVATGKENHFSGVSAYQFDESGEWLSCEVNSKNQSNESKELLLYELADGTEKRFPDLAGYSFAASGKSLLLQTRKKIDDATITALQYLSLKEKIEAKTIWSTKNEKVAVTSQNMDDPGIQVVFGILDSSNGAKGESIWYYKKGMDAATVKVSDQMNGIPKEFLIQGPGTFTENGHYIQFSLRQSSGSTKPKTEMAQVEVWNYKDRIMPSVDTYNKPVTAVIGTRSQQVIPLETEGKTVYKLQGDYAIVKKPGNEIHGDRFWEDGYYDDSTWLLSLTDGSHHLLPTKCEKENDVLWFSPGGKYIIYFDARRGCQYFSYDLRTKEESALAANIPPGELGHTSPDEYNSAPEIPIGIAAWLQNDEGVLVYGQQDIWLLDLAGKKSAINITNGYGLAHNIITSLFNGERLNFGNVPSIIKKKDSLLLQSFNSVSKYSGFYRKILSKPGDPELLYSGPYFYNMIKGCHDENMSNNGQIPIKANDAKVWVVQRQSGTEAPNYYKTSDFKSFSRLTNFQPQAGFNWYTQELHSYQHLDGKYGQGILYKPEDFDASKRYPAIIIFYGAFSNNLYEFRVPSLNHTVISPGQSPAWFLNNGYLVFTPDIYVAPLQYGPTAFNVIEGAAKYLKQLPFIDSNKLGCGSHSWSAQLGAYIFTHSTSIAATAISEGMQYGNMLNYAFSPTKRGSRLEASEKGRQSGSLWENKESWLDQTTVLNADKSKSPLLLFCNKESSEDYQDQTFQIFNALRRLDKNVWWLKYEKGSHTLDDPDEMKDFTIRYTQYFDHYLQYSPAPTWMTQGIPVKLKGIESRYELDPSGSCSLFGKNDCPICNAWNEQYKRTPEMFQKGIKDWVLDKDIADELKRKQNERRTELNKESVVRTSEVMQMLNK